MVFVARFRLFLPWLLLPLMAWGASPADKDAPTRVTFERHVYPIFRAHCFDCHGADEEVQGGLDLQLRRFLLEGGDSGPAMTPGAADESYLIQRIRDGEMPPGDTKLLPDELELLERWIREGAPTARPEPAEIGPGIGMTDEEREFWSFQPIRRPALPSFQADDRVRSSIDALVLESMRSQGLSFSPDADKLTLLRRATLDLTGLPPSLDKIQEFLDDNSPTAYERLIDDLLESPHYGERWARHWLDIAGYADSEGYSNDDRPRLYAYKFRDYVIRSLNADKPLDQFLVEQLAGDELLAPPYTNLTEDETGKLTATGFLRMADDGSPLGLRAKLDGWYSPTGGARVGEPNLDASLWSWDRRDTLRIRTHGDASNPSRTAGLAGRRFDANLARRIENESRDLVKQIQAAWHWTLSRPADEDEIEMAREFIEDQVAFLHSQHVASLKTGGSELQVVDREPGEVAELAGETRDAQQTTNRDASIDDSSIDDASWTAWRHQALTNLCQTLFSSNEFLYVD